MANRIDADNERWEIRFSNDAPRPGTHVLLFHCVSNPSRPYHVAEVPADRVPDAGAVDRLSAAELSDFFAQSDVMGIVRDPAADPAHPHAHPIPDQHPRS